MYEKQTWITGDVITEEKLNHMEDGIAGVNIPLYTPEIIGQHGGANHYQFYASFGGGATEPIALIKQEDPNDLFKMPQIGLIDGENIDATAEAAVPMPIPGTWALNIESPETMAIGPVETKTEIGFYLNEEISSANLYHIGDVFVAFMDHIPNLEYVAADPLG